MGIPWDYHGKFEIIPKIIISNMTIRCIACQLRLWIGFLYLSFNLAYQSYPTSPTKMYIGTFKYFAFLDKNIGHLCCWCNRYFWFNMKFYYITVTKIFSFLVHFLLSILFEITKNPWWFTTVWYNSNFLNFFFSKVFCISICIVCQQKRLERPRFEGVDVLRHFTKILN